MLKEGTKAPDFTLECEDGRVKLKDLAGKVTVLYFYPRDSTPGCTREAQAFSASLRDFTKLGAVVLGVSKDSVDSHRKFRDKFDLKIKLLSDPDLTAHKAYGAYGEKMMYGKKVLGTIRSTFVIDPRGKVTRIFRNVRVDGHADAVREAVRELTSASKASSKAAGAH